MKNKLLFGILIGLASVVMLIMAFPFGIIFALVFWIYLGVLIWSGKPVFHEELDSQTADKRLNSLKRIFLLAALSFIIAAISIVMHNTRSGLSGSEESLHFFVGIITAYIFILASVMGLIIFLKARQKPI